jgi:hypothetical protein
MALSGECRGHRTGTRLQPASRSDLSLAGCGGSPEVRRIRNGSRLITRLDRNLNDLSCSGRGGTEVGDIEAAVRTEGHGRRDRSGGRGVRSTRRQRRWHWREAERKQVTRQAAGPLRHTARLSWATKPWFSSRFLRGRGCGRWNTKQIAGTLVGNSIPRQWLFRILFGRRP